MERWQQVWQRVIDAYKRIPRRVWQILLLALIALGLTKALGVTITVFLLGVCIAVHEWGHLFVMRRNGVKVAEYAIGFGPVAWQWRLKKSGILFSIRLVPLGGFVRAEGEGATGAGISKPWPRFKIAMAGMVMNAVTGSLTFMAMMWIFGVQSPPWFPRPDVIPNWLWPVIVGPLLTFGLWIATPAILVWIPIAKGGMALVNGMAGPIGIVHIGSTINMGVPVSLIVFKYLFLFWMVSVGVAGANLLPIMPLDGANIPNILIDKWYAWRRTRLRVRCLLAAAKSEGNRPQVIIAEYEAKDAALVKQQETVRGAFASVSLLLIFMLFIVAFGGDIWRLITNHPAIKL